MSPRKILSFAVGPLFSGVLAVFSIPLLAWFFQPEDIGRNNIYQVCMSFSVLFFGFGLDQAYVREYHESDRRADLLKACFAPGLFALVFTALISIVYWREISLALFGVAVKKWYFLLVFCAFFTFIERFLSLVLRMKEKGILFSLCQIVPKIAILSGIFFAYKLDADRDYSLLLSINFVSLVCVVGILLHLNKIELIGFIKSNLDADLVSRVFRFGLPLVGAGLAYWGLSASTSMFLRHFSGFKDLGLYSMAVSLAGVFTIFQTVFTTVWMPIVFKWVANGESLDRVDIVVRRVVFFIGVAFSLAGIFSFVLDYLLPSDYKIINTLIVCSIAQPLLYTLSEVTVIGLAIKRKSSFSLLAALSALTSNVLFCLALVPRYGASGAVVANAIAYFTFLVARTEFSALFWRSPRRLLIYGGLFLPLAGAVVSVIAGESFESDFRVFWTVMLVAFLGVFRSDAIDMIRYIARYRSA